MSEEIRRDETIGELCDRLVPGKPMEVRLCAAGLWVKNDDAETWPGWQEPCWEPPVASLLITDSSEVYEFCARHVQVLEAAGLIDVHRPELN